jgi:hypothetical protein
VSQRQTWTFGFRAVDVAETAQKLLTYHEAKTATWLERERAAEVEVQKSVTVGEGYATVAGKSTVVGEPQFDKTKLAVLHEAQMHRKEHQAQAEHYRRWADVLAKQSSDVELRLDYDDLVYFGIAGSQTSAN